MKWGDTWTEQEKEKLKYLCEEKGDVLSFDDIAKKLNRTVGSVRGACHRLKIRKKSLNGYKNLYIQSNSLVSYIKLFMEKEKISVNGLAYSSGVDIKIIEKILELEIKKPEKEILKKIADVLNADYNQLLILSGHRKDESLKKRRFKTSTIWEVKNVLLMGVLYSYDIKISELADSVGVSDRTVQRWIYEGREPNDENTKKVVEILKINKNILFGEYSKRKEINL